MNISGTIFEASDFVALIFSPERRSVTIHRASANFQVTMMRPPPNDAFNRTRKYGAFFLVGTSDRGPVAFVVRPHKEGSPCLQVHATVGQ